MYARIWAPNLCLKCQQPLFDFCVCTDVVLLTGCDEMGMSSNKECLVGHSGGDRQRKESEGQEKDHLVMESTREEKG